MVQYNQETIGIIGGCGVAAANELVQRIEKKLTVLGCEDDQQQPEIILYQATQAPSRIAYAAGQTPLSFAPYFIDVGRKLKMCGATFCCIPCNTAHCAIDEIVEGVGLPFVDIIEETLKVVEARFPHKKIGVLGSSGTRASHIYENGVQKGHFSSEIITVSDRAQASEDAGIAAIKRGMEYRNIMGARDFFSLALNELAASGVEAIILGCTEIPLVFREPTWEGIPLIDTIEVLADACICKCRKV